MPVIPVVTNVSYADIPVGTFEDFKKGHKMLQVGNMALVAITPPDPEYAPHLLYWGPDPNNFRVVHLSR